jgi:SPX domain protein involved in polyphosphate accumulation
MKFGQQLNAHLTPEWRKQYISYEELKIILYDFLEKAPPLEREEEPVRQSYTAKTDEEFFAICQVELTKINLFYSQKLAEAQGKFHELSRDLESFKRISAAHAHLSLKSPMKMIKVIK